MAVPANTFKTFEAKGIREDLSDVIYNISPEETPFMANAGRGTANSTFFEYQQDVLAAADGANAVLEGDDASIDAVVPTVRIGANVQISRKSVSVSGSEEKIKKAGRSSEMSYQKAKKSAELKRDMETILLSNQGTTPGAAGVARKLAGLPAWVKTAVDKEATGVNPVYTTTPSAVRTDGALRAITEAMVKNVLQLSWVQGGATSTLMVNGTNKQAVSAFAGIATKTINQSAAKAATIIGAADIYVGDFGTLSVVANRFQRTRDAWLLDFDLIDIMYFRKFEDQELAKTGDTTKRQFIVEYGLKVKQEAGLGLVTDLS